MCRYYFHLRLDGRVIADPEGTDLPDIATAHQEALASARQILADVIKSGKEEIPEAFIITDGDGHEIEILPLVAAMPHRLRQHVPTGETFASA